MHLIGSKSMFFRKDMDKDSTVNFQDLKMIMERLRVPQTHLDMKSVASKQDQNQNEKMVTLREVCSIDKIQLN